MTRHTIETVREEIATLRDRDTVYKVEVDALKGRFLTAFQNDWRTLNSTKYLDTPREQRTESDTSLYFAAPNEPRHWYGKKFSAFLVDCPDSSYKDATVSHRNRWRPLFLALEDLKKRQVKGRRPAEKKAVIATRTQLRAICPCCFKQHAVWKGRTMVAHGYTLEYGFQNGSCSGTGEPHFGTPEGRDVASTNAADAAHRAKQMHDQMDRFENGEEHVTVRFADYRGRWTTVSNPTDAEKQRFITGRRREADGYNRYAAELNQRIADWKAAAPVEVEVEITE